MEGRTRVQGEVEEGKGWNGEGRGKGEVGGSALIIGGCWGIDAPADQTYSRPAGKVSLKRRKYTTLIGIFCWMLGERSRDGEADGSWWTRTNDRAAAAVRRGTLRLQGVECHRRTQRSGQHHGAL